MLRSLDANWVPILQGSRRMRRAGSRLPASSPARLLVEGAARLLVHASFAERVGMQRDRWMWHAGALLADALRASPAGQRGPVSDAQAQLADLAALP